MSKGVSKVGVEWESGGVISIAIGGIKGSRKLSEHPCHI